ncbi:MAG TPA: hypothetical protein DCS93_40615 [Microscillaceae bacterium]|nr:hypothetical protein [Microscillaceae bacterium]
MDAIVIKADILSYIPLPALLLDVTSRQILAVNDNFLQLTDVTRTAVIGKKLSALSQWDPDQRLNVYLNQSTGNPETGIDHEIRWLMADGSFQYFRMDCSIAAVSPHTQVILTLQNIDKEKKLEAKLERQQEVFRSVFDNSPIPKLLTNLDGQIIKANDEFCLMVGYNMEDVCEKQIVDIINPDDLPTLVMYQKQLLHEPLKSFELEKRFLHRSGKEIFTLTHISVLYDEHNQASRFYIQAINIQARKEAEFERERFRSILNQAGEAIIIADAPTGQIIDFNHTVCRNLGYTRAEFQNLTIYQIIKEDKNTLTKRFDDLIRNPRKTLRFQVTLQRKNNTQYPAEVSVSYRSFRGQKYLTAIARDISQEVDSADKIMEGEARFRSIFEETNMGIALTDTRGNFVECNQALADMLGYTRDEILDLHIMDIAYPDDVRVNGDNSQDFFKVKSLEKRYRKKNGEILWGRLTNSTIRDKHGRPLYGVGMIEDITARKMVEVQNIEHESLLNSINENLSEGIYRTSPTGGIVYINPAFALLFGFNRITEAYTIHPDDLYDDVTQRERLREILDREGYFKNQEVCFKRKDGSVFWGLLNSHVTRRTDGKVFYDGTIIDITEKKLSEELLMTQNDDLQKINSELDRFVYSASHDLRAPLTSIMGLVNIAENENPAPNLAKYLQMIKKSILKLDLFVQDIINYSKNSRLEIARESIDFEELVQGSLENLQFLKGSDQIEKSVEVHYKDGATDFYSDPTRLNIIFNNTLSNAIKYHNASTKSPFVKIAAHIHAQGVTIEISDNGKGIPEESIHRIFDMFYRASEDSKGSGLGLYIVKETVEKLKGEVSLESTLHQGTVITIQLPNVDTAQETFED